MSCNCRVDEDGSATICYACVTKMQEYKEERDKVKKYTRADITKMINDISYLLKHQQWLGMLTRGTLEHIQQYLQHTQDIVPYDLPDMSELPMAWLEIGPRSVSGGPID